MAPLKASAHRLNSGLDDVNFNQRKLSGTSNRIQQSGFGIEWTQRKLWQRSMEVSLMTTNSVTKEKGEMVDESFLEMFLFIKHAA